MLQMVIICMVGVNDEYEKAQIKQIRLQCVLDSPKSMYNNISSVENVIQCYRSPVNS